MSEGLKLTIIILSIAIGVSLLIFGISWLVVFLQRKKGVYLKRKVHSILSRFASIRNFKALTDVNIEIDGRKAHFDNLLIGFFGLLAIDCLPEQGEYYGEKREEKWILVQNEKKKYLKNPLNVLVEDIDVLRTVFAKNNVFKMQMEEFVLVDPSVKKTLLYLAPNLPVLRPKELKKMIHRVKYEKDNNVDVKQIVELIGKYSAK